MRIIVVGLGDLGRRLATLLALRPSDAELEVSVAGRPRPSTVQFTRTLRRTARVPVHFVPVDEFTSGAFEYLLSRERPDVAVHCAALLDPWLVPSRRDPIGRALGRAGFALQLPAQLPLIRNFMRAVRTAAPDLLVVNCSYPDVVNAVLSTEQLAPTVGAGNVQMIQHRIMGTLAGRAALSEGALTEPVRVIAHHAQVDAAMRGCPPPTNAPRPRVFVGPSADPEDDLAYAGDPLPGDRSRNALSAVGVAQVVLALAGHGRRQLSLPAPGGLPGGYPVDVNLGSVELDLPPQVDLASARALNEAAAHLDGVDRIQADGTVFFTPAARIAIESVDTRLAEPLTLGDVEARWDLLRDVLSR